MDAFADAAHAAADTIHDAVDSANDASGGGVDAYNTGYQDGMAGAADDAVNRVGFGLATYYESGYQAGRQAAAASTPTYDGPSIGNVEPGTVPIDQYNKPFNDAFDDVFHEDMPHIDPPDYPTGYSGVDVPVVPEAEPPLAE